MMSNVKAVLNVESADGEVVTLLSIRLVPTRKTKHGPGL